MKIKPVWLLVIGWWIYFITALFLYIYVKVAWINWVDALAGVVLTAILSVWYTIDRIRYRGGRPRTSHWLITLFGIRQNPNYRPPKPHDDAETPISKIVKG